MKVSQLRDLTRKFAAGGLSEDEYRRERGKLIDGIVNGDIQPRYREIHPEDIAKRPVGTRRRRVMGIAAALVLVALLLAAVLVQFMSPTDDTAARASGDNIAQPEPGVELLRSFLEQDSWDDNSLENMESQWNALSGFEREAARNSHHYRRLKAQTESRIREYEALAIDNPQALLQAARLRMFAERLNFTPDT